MAGLDWAVAIAAAASVLVLPGLGLTVAVGLRGWVALGASPLATMGTLGVAAVLTEVASLPWHPLTILAVWVLLTGGTALAARRLGGSVEAQAVPWSSRSNVLVGGSVVLAAVVILRPFVSAMGDVSELFWNFDSAFHYNAARLVIDEGQLTQLTLDNVNNYDNPGGGFYPPLLYGVAALLGSLYGVGAVSSVNVAVLACFSVVLPLGLVGLVRALGSSPFVAVGVLLCAGMVEAYPVDSLIRGPIFPFAASLTLVAPLLVMLLVTVETQRRQWPLVSSVLGIGAVGAFLLHSSFPYSVAVFAVPLVVQLLVQKRASLTGMARLVPAAAIAVVVAAPLLHKAWGQLSVVTAFSKWEPDRTPAQALGNVLTSSHIKPYYSSTESIYPQWWVAALLLIGIVAATRLRPSFEWVIGSWAISTGLFVVAAGIEDPTLRVLVSPWFSDRWRLWGIAGLAIIVLAGIGLGGLLAFAYERTRTRPAIAVFTSAGIVVGFVYVTDLMYTNRITDVTRSYFATSERTLTDEELDAYNWLASQPDSDTVILNQWVDGSALMLALEGLRPAWGSYNLRSGDTDRQLLWESFNELSGNPEVQRVVRDRGIRYVVVGESYPYDGGTLGPAPGLENLDSTDGLSLVYSNSDTKVYRVSEEFLATAWHRNRGNGVVDRYGAEAVAHSGGT